MISTRAVSVELVLRVSQIKDDENSVEAKYLHSELTIRSVLTSTMKKDVPKRRDTKIRQKLTSQSVL